MADVVERRIVEVLGRIDQNFARQLNEINRQLKTVQSNVKQLRDLGVGAGGLLGGIVSVGTLHTFQQLLDTQTQLERSLKALIPPYQDLAKTQQELLLVSQQTHVAYQATVELYNRLAIAVKGLGIAHAEVVDSIKAFNLATVVSGTGAREAAAAATQFGQALASGRLQGDEFRSIMENVPLLARTLADNFEDASGKIGVSVGKLRELSRAGELTTEKVVEATGRSLAELEKMAAGVPRTMAAATQAIADSLSQVAHEVDKLEGITPKFDAFAKTITDFVTRNAEPLARIAGPLVIGALVAAAGVAAVSLGLLLTSVATLAGPLGVLALAAGAVTSAFLLGIEAIDGFQNALKSLLGLNAAEELEKSVSVEGMKKAVEEITGQLDALVKARDATADQLARSKAGTGPVLNAGETEALTKKLADQEAQLEAMRKKYESLLDVMEKTSEEGALAAAAFEKQAAAAEAFSDATKDIRSATEDIEAQRAAVADSVQAYEDVKLNIEVANEQLKEWTKISKDASLATDENKQKVFDLVAARIRAKDALEQEVKAAKTLAEFREKGSAAEREVEQSKQLVEAIRESGQAYEDTKDKIDRTNKIIEIATKLAEDHVKVTYDQVAALADQELAIDHMNATLDRYKDQLKATAELNQGLFETYKNTTDIENNTAALLSGGKALEDFNKQREKQQRLDEKLKDLKFIDPTQLQALREAIDLEVEREAAQSKALKVSKGREAFAPALEALKQEVTLQREVTAAAKGGEEARDAILRKQEQLTEAQKVLNLLDKEDVAEKDKQQDIVNRLARELVQLKHTEDQRIDGAKEAAKLREKELRDAERLREQAERERIARAEKRETFLAPEGPLQRLELELPAAREQLAAIDVLSKKQSDAAKNRLKDEQEIRRFLALSFKAGIEDTEQYREHIRFLIEEERKVNDEIAKRLEMQELLSKTLEMADPFKKLREEAEAINKAMADNEFVTDAQKNAAVERLHEIESAMNGLHVTAENLAGAGNPFAGIVQAAAEIADLTDKEFANMTFGKQFAEGGQAVLAVLGQVQTTMQALGIENFEFQKAMAIATASMQAALAIVAVLSDATIPTVARISLAALIAGLVGAQIAAIASQEPPQRQFGGPVVGQSMYRVGEAGPEMFRSLSGKNYMIPGEGGTVIPNSKVGSSVIVNNQGPPLAVVDQRQDQNGNTVLTVDAAVKAVRRDFEKQMNDGYGAYPKSISKNTWAKRRIA